jgi:hypothetical protein
MLACALTCAQTPYRRGDSGILEGHHCQRVSATFVCKLYLHDARGIAFVIGELTTCGGECLDRAHPLESCICFEDTCRCVRRLLCGIIAWADQSEELGQSQVAVRREDYFASSIDGNRHNHFDDRQFLSNAAFQRELPTLSPISVIQPQTT